MIARLFNTVSSIVKGSTVTSNITVELVKKGLMYTAQIVIPGLNSVIYRNWKKEKNWDSS